jgi:hypothetical protein
MKITKLALAILTIIISITCLSFFVFAETRDQYQTTQTSEMTADYGKIVKQSFVPSMDGQLTKVRLYMRWNGAYTCAAAMGSTSSYCKVKVSILDDSGSRIGSETQYDASYMSSSFSWKDITMSGVTLTSGTRYWIQVISSYHDSLGGGLRWGKSTSDTYAAGGYKWYDGSLWISNSYDMTFETYMNPPSCMITPGWKCYSSNQRAYQNADCTWTSITTCPSGQTCGGAGVCSTPTANMDITRLYILKNAASESTTFVRGDSAKFTAVNVNRGATGSRTTNFEAYRGTARVASNTYTGTATAGYENHDYMLITIPSDWTDGSYEFRSSITPCSSPSTCSRSMAFTVGGGSTPPTCAERWSCSDTMTVLHNRTDCTSETTRCATGQVCSAGACVTSTPASATFTVDSIKLSNGSGVAKTTFYPGDRVWMHGTVRNVGTAAGAGTYNYYIDKDGANLYNIFYNYSVSAGATYNSASTYTVPVGAAAGIYTYRMRVSPCTPTTATCERSMTFTVGTPPSAIFTLSNARITNTAGTTIASVPQGSAAYLKADTRNSGTASGTDTTTFLIRKDGTVLYQANQSRTLNAGLSYTESRYTTIGPCSSSCEASSMFNVTRTCTVSYICANITHMIYQNTDCSLAWPRACTARQACSGSFCTTCTAAMCGANARCSTTGPGCVCNANYSNVDGSWINGCEVNLLNDTRNCGAVGHACGASETCNSGVCELMSMPEGDYMVMSKGVFTGMAERMMDEHNVNNYFFVNMSETEAEDYLAAVVQHFANCPDDLSEVASHAAEMDELGLHPTDAENALSGVAACLSIVKYTGKLADFIWHNSPAVPIRVMVSPGEAVGDLVVVYKAEEPITTQVPRIVSTTISKYEETLHVAHGFIGLGEILFSVWSGTEMYDGSLLHGIMYAGEKQLEKAEFICEVLDFVNDIYPPTMMSKAVVMRMYPGFRPVTYTELFRAIMRPINASAHGFADGVDTCIHNGEVLECTDNDFHLALLLTNALPFIESFNDTTAPWMTDRVDFHAGVWNTNLIASGWVYSQVLVNTNQRTIVETPPRHFFLIQGFNRAIPYGHDYSFPLNEGERPINATLTTYTVCVLGFEDCRFHDSKTITYGSG